MNKIIIYNDNEIEVDKEIAPLILNYLTTLGDWGGSDPESLGEPEWSDYGTGTEEYRMCISSTEGAALIANQELLGINIEFRVKQ